MRVVLLNQYYAPDEAATAQLLADVGEGLVRAGHRVGAVCSRRSYADPSRRYPARETVGGVDVRRARATGFGRSSRLGRLIDYATFLVGAAWRLLLRERPDVVVSLSTPPMVASVGWLAARLRGAASVYWVMDVYPDVAYALGVLRRGSPGGRLLDFLSRSLVCRSDRVVALGEMMAGRLAARDPGKVVVVHNWADGEAIRPRPAAGHPRRQSWGWDGRFVVLYSGNMGLAHEFETVLSAAELFARDREILFAFVGGGPRRREVEQQAARRGLANVEFRSYVERDELGESLTAGDVHLVTLRPGLEGLLVPSKIYGILAAGRPTLYVGPADGEIPDILKRGACGTSVRNGAALELAQAVREYKEDPSRRLEEGRRARALFEEAFTRERGVDAFVQVVQETAA